MTEIEQVKADIATLQEISAKYADVRVPLNKPITILEYVLGTLEKEPINDESSSSAS